MIKIVGILFKIIWKKAILLIKEVKYLFMEMENSVRISIDWRIIK
jgi:hypothetical protein